MEELFILWIRLLIVCSFLSIFIKVLFSEQDFKTGEEIWSNKTAMIVFYICISIVVFPPILFAIAILN